MFVFQRTLGAAVALLLGFSATLPAQTSEVWTTSYDVRNRLSEVRRGSDILLRLEYDAEGRLSKKVGAEGVRQYLYDGINLIGEYDGDGNELVKYDWGPGPYGRDQLIRYSQTSVPGGPSFYPLFDGNGSVSGLADSAGRPVAGYHLDAWGNFRFPAEINASANRFAYTAYRYMPEAGIYFAVSRFYDPTLGRFLTRDTYLGDIANVPTLHRYGYARNNPTGYIDPDGHESYRQWIGLDKPTASVEIEFLKNFGYDAWNAVSFGALSRQDSLVEKSEAGLISEGQYQAGTGINLGGTLAVAAGSAYTGGAVGQLVGGSLGASWAAGGAAAGFVASSGNAALDVATGARGFDQVTASEVVLGTVIGGVTGRIAGGAAMEGTLPFSRYLMPQGRAWRPSERPVTVVEGRTGAELVPMSPNSGNTPPPIRWVDETATMSPQAARYQAGAEGARSSVATRLPQAPEISYKVPDGSTKPVRFDGLEETVLIDRKVSVTTFPKSQSQALRQSQALKANGLKGRWEVPTEAEAVRARRMFEKLGITNIEVRVVTNE